MSTTVSSRRAELLALLTAGALHAPLVARVCEVSAALLGVSGAGTCRIGGRHHRIIVHGTDRLGEELEDLQVTLGEGPCTEAVRTGRPVLVREALARGVRALFTFPLQAGEVQLGALDLHRRAPRPFTPERIAHAHLLADVASRSVLAQRGRVHVDGSVSALHWLSVQHWRSVPGRGRAVDLGITVRQALAPTWPDGADDALRSEADGGVVADRG